MFVKRNANSKDGQDHEDIYFDTSRKILSQEMIKNNVEALILIFLKVMTNVIKNIGQMSSQKVKYHQNDFIL